MHLGANIPGTRTLPPRSIRQKLAHMPKARKPPATKATFIETMDCLPVTRLPEGEDWTYEIKLDGYRLEAVKNGSTSTLYSRRHTILNEKYPDIADALQKLPDATVIDGELVTMDETGKSDFNRLQNFRSAATQIHYVAFDILMHRGTPLIDVPLHERRQILHKILPANDRISSAPVDNSGTHLLDFVRKHGLEGVIAKRANSLYEPGKRSGLWSKHRINLGQEFVVGGYTPGGNGFDALVIGFYVGKELYFAARVRAGFVPATRREVFAQMKDLKIAKCPFVNLPEKSAGRWGQGLTAEKMKSCIWLKPVAVVRIDVLEWTGGDKLRHPKFIALRDDKDPRRVVRES